MAQYVTDKAGAVELLSLLTPTADIDVAQAEAGPSVYGKGYSVSRWAGRYNGQDFMVFIYDTDRRTIAQRLADCTCGDRENYSINCPVHGLKEDQ